MFNVRHILSLEYEYVKLFLPVVLIFSTAMGLPLVTLLYAGKISENHLAGVGLGNTVTNIFLTSTLFGYASVFDTYGPQVYGSSKRNELGTVLMKCIAQGTLVYMVILGPYLNIVYLIDLLPQEATAVVSGDNVTNSDTAYVIDDGEDTVQNIAIRYIRLTCCVGFMDYLISLLTRYLTIQRKIAFVYIAVVLVVVLHVLFNQLFYSFIDKGVEGLALAAVCARTTSLVIMVVFCFLQRSDLIWTGFSMKIFDDWKPMLKLGLSGSINVVAELGLFEVATFLSQFNGVTALSTILIQFQITTMIYSLTFGVAYSTAVLIGNALGEGNKDLVKSYIVISIVNVILEAVPVAIITFLLRDQIVHVFSPSEDVVTMFNASMYMLVLVIPFDHLQAVISRGILIAFGKQCFIALSLCFFCYGVGLPIVVLTVFYTDLNTVGIYIGFLTFVVLNLVAVSVRLSRIDISEEIDNVKEMVTALGDTGDVELEHEFYNTMSTDTPPKPPKSEGVTVLVVFVIAAVGCVVLGGLSFIRKY